MNSFIFVLIELSRYCGLSTAELLKLRHGDFHGDTGLLDLSRLNRAAIDLTSSGLAEKLRFVYLGRSMTLSPETPFTDLFTPRPQNPEAFKRYLRRYIHFR